MDLIAHFWERLPQTPPLQRNDLHLIISIDSSTNDNINVSTLNSGQLAGAMLYVPKAHRADVLANDAATAAAFCMYITQRGPAAVGAMAGKATIAPFEVPGEHFALMDLSAPGKGGAAPMDFLLPTSNAAASNGEGGGGKVPIDFLTGPAETIGWMVPTLLPIVHRKAPARELVNVVMQLPPDAHCESDPNVRLARDSDLPTLNRWRKQYREERGILFNADMDASVDTGRVFVYEHEKQVVGVAKFDLELQGVIEIGGVYTFPEHRNQGFGGKIVTDLACRVRAAGKVPLLQVDEENTPALKLYESMGWMRKGKLAHVWLTG